MSDATKAMIERVAAAIEKAEGAYHPVGSAQYLQIARAAIDAMSEWQPIETAPREDGKPVLVWDGHWMAVAVPMGLTSWMIENSFGFNEDGEIYDVTHWQPLPEPPQP